MRNTMVGEGVSLYLFWVLTHPACLPWYAGRKWISKVLGGMIEMHNIYPCIQISMSFGSKDTNYPVI